MGYSWLRQALFQLKPETAHHWALTLLKAVPSAFFKAPPTHPIDAMGLTFPHRIGLAAGLDKNGDYLDALAKLGFSFIELGTITPKPQWGNPRPRLFRLPDAHALINRMGFNNRGVDALVNNVMRARYDGILGINIGKNKDTPLADAAHDYVHCLRKVYAYASYVTVNISSPNTPDLRQLQQEHALHALLYALTQEQKKLEDTHQKHVPLLVKISPDESDDDLKRMAQCALHHGLSGMIATNTTNARPNVEGLPYANETGGLSGRPLQQHALQSLRILKSETGDAMTLIGVGGIDSVQSAKERLDAGASLLQVYTGLIYEGPYLLQKLALG